MAKTTKPMIKVSIIAYIPAPDMMDRDSFEACHNKLEKIESFIREEATEVARFAKDPVGRQYDVEEPKAAEAAPKAEGNATTAAPSLIGSNVQPASWATEEGTVQLGDVVSAARLKASLSIEEWNEQDESAREALIADMVEEMKLKPEDAE